MTPADDGLPAAVARTRDLIASAWDDGNAVGLDGWIGPDRGETPDDYAIRHREGIVDRLAEAVARAAREDVAETVREARADGVEEAARHVRSIDCPNQPMAAWLDEFAATIRAGEA